MVWYVVSLCFGMRSTVMFQSCALLEYLWDQVFLQSGPLEGLTGNWLFHNFSTQYFEEQTAITPAEVIPRVRCACCIALLQ